MKLDNPKTDSRKKVYIHQRLYFDPILGIHMNLIRPLNLKSTPQVANIPQLMFYLELEMN